MTAQEYEISTDTLIVGYTTAPPFIVQNGENLGGINIWLWERVAKDLELAYELKPMSFSGMLDSLGRGAIDVSINPLTITSERSKLMEMFRKRQADLVAKAKQAKPAAGAPGNATAQQKKAPAPQ